MLDHVERTGDHRGRAVLRECLLFAAYAVLGAAATFPLVNRFTSGVPRGGDIWVAWWNLWWVRESIVVHHQPPFFTDLVHAPDGTFLYFHTLNLLPSVIAAPLLPLVGYPAAINLIVLASFALGGYLAYRLALFVLRSHRGSGDPRAVRAAALVGGAIFALSSYHLAHTLGHPDLASIEVIPAFALAFLKSQTGYRWRDVALSVVALTAAILTAFYHALFLVVWAVLLSGYTAWTKRRWREPFAVMACCFAATAAVCLPLIVPMLRHASDARLADPHADAVRFSADLLAFVAPSPLSTVGRVLDTAGWPMVARAGTNSEIFIFAGFGALLLGAIGLFSCARALRFWILTALAFAALALGPILHIAGHPLPGISAVMPYRVVAALPYGNLARVPSRYSVMSTLALSVMAAAGTSTLLRRRPLRQAAAIAAAAVALVLVENMVVPYPISTPRVPRYFSDLATDGPSGTLLEVPIPDDPGEFPLRMLYQTVHHRPVFGGYISRGVPPLNFSAIPGFAQLKQLTPAIDDVVDYDRATLGAISLAALNFYKTGEVAIEKRLMDADRVARAGEIAAGLLGAAASRFDDDDVAAYRVPANGDVPPAMWLERGWSSLERAPGEHRSRERWRWMSDAAGIRLITSQPANVAIDMTLQAFRRERHVEIDLDGRAIGRCTVTLAKSACRTDSFALDSGSRLVTIRALEPPEPATPDPRRLSVALSHAALVASN